ncbi:hypothetical protein Tco_1295340 [Tanacetum coccineum]
MTEMNGRLCSTTPMRIRTTTNKNAINRQQYPKGSLFCTFGAQYFWSATMVIARTLRFEAAGKFWSGSPNVLADKWYNYWHIENKCESYLGSPKRGLKDYTYHKKKLMMCKQAKHGVPLQAKQADWPADTDEEIDEQELEAHYSFMAKIQEVLHEESSSTDQPLEQDDSNVTLNSSDMCNNDNQVDQNDDRMFE